MLCIHSLPSSDRVVYRNDDGFSVLISQMATKLDSIKVTSPSRLLLPSDAQNTVDYKPHKSHNGPLLVGFHDQLSTLLRLPGAMPLAPLLRRVIMLIMFLRH
jgi:hypothetical protein